MILILSKVRNKCLIKWYYVGYCCIDCVDVSVVETKIRTLCVFISDLMCAYVRTHSVIPDLIV